NNSQMNNLFIHKKSDIWPFGLIINELFSNEKPWMKHDLSDPIQIIGLLIKNINFPISSKIEHNYKSIYKLIEQCTEYD
ncbi:hypothetical protein, partial [Enterococcus faecium]|uniref:hypothetical protein n=1 Tax=Enterococcus faecium TaxID=1352 RepID=UPI003DA023E0